MVVGYDPIQRSTAWKRRVDREERAILNNMFGPSVAVQIPALVDADTRLELLSQHLHPGGRPGSGRSSLHSEASGRSRSSASSAGRSIATTPRLGSAKSGSSASSVPQVQRIAGSALSRGRSSATASSTLRAELEEERQRRAAVESELDMLRSMLGAI